MLNEYILYKGDEIITIGTAREIADHQNIKLETVYWLGTKKNKDRDKGNRKILVKIEDDLND